MSAALVLRELAEAFNAGDWSKLRQTVHEEVVVVDIAAGGEVRVGADALVQGDKAWRGAFSNFEVEILAIVGDSRVSAGDFMLRGVHTGPLPTPWGNVPATGREVELPFAMFCEVADGKVAVIRDHYNATVAMAQLGVGPKTN